MAAASNGSARLNAAMLTALLFYSALAAAGCVIVSLLIDRPIRLDPMAVPPLFSAMRYHAIVAALAGIAWLRMRRNPASMRATRLVLSFCMVAIIGSMDRLLGVGCPPPADNGSLFEPHSRRGWTYHRNTTGRTGGVDVRLNALGMRGADVPREKPAGEYRVLLLGDSIAFGYGIEERDSLAVQLERAMQRKMDGGHVRVMNMGVMGYTTWQECDYLEHEGVALTPDAVVLVFCFNDVMDLLGVGPDDVSGLLPEFRPSTARFHWSGLVRAARTAYDANRNVVGRWLGERHFPRETFRETFGDPPSPRAAAAWKRTLGDLERMSDFCRERKLPLLVTAFPYREQLESPDAPRPQRQLEEWAARSNVSFLDLMPALKLSGEHPEALFEDPLHPTAAGSLLAATAISEFLFNRRGN